jgi:hypothetical protein
MTKQTITGDMCVQRLKHHGVFMTAKEIAESLGMGDSRAVATALRNPVRDGRVKINYKNGLGLGAQYRFVRMTAKGGAA